MALLSPWFLAGALALGLPVWLHLLNRENPIRLPFSSLMFFESRKQTSVKERQLRYRLLLAMRLLLYLLLALAFAKPIWERVGSLVGANLPKLHFIALDTSLSMNYGDRWQRAVAEAEAVVQAMEPRDRAQVISFGPGVTVATEPTMEPAELLNAIRTLQPTASRNSYGDLAEAVRSLAPEKDVPVVVHLLSDFQQSAMPGRFSDLALPTVASLAVHNLGEDSSPNWAIESIKGTLRLHGGRKARLEATVAGFGAEASTRTVTFSINGERVASKSVDVPAMGRASVVFEDFEVPAGSHRAEVVIEPDDDLAIDNKRLVAIDNTAAAPILFVYSDSRRRDLLYYRAALEASADSRFRVQGASLTQAEQSVPDRFATVVLSDIPIISGEFAGRLESYIKAGGSALVVLGPKTTLAQKAALYPKAIGDVRYARREGRRFQPVGSFDEAHPVLSEVERFRGVKFYRYANLEPDPAEEVLVRLADGSPLLIERKLGDGQILVLTSSLDNVWNDLPVNPVFVPFALATVRYLSGVDEGIHQATVDSVLELSKRRSPGSMVQVFDPSGERALSLTQAVSGGDLALTELGFYEVRRPGETQLVAVNPDPRESNLRPMDPELVEAWESTGGGPTDETATQGEESHVKPPPVEIWRLLLLLLVAITLIESVVGNLHLKVQREV